jgi:hypothetical protein
MMLGDYSASGSLPKYESMTWFIRVVQTHYMFVGLVTQEGSFGDTA